LRSKKARPFKLRADLGVMCSTNMVQYNIKCPACDKFIESEKFNKSSLTEENDTIPWYKLQKSKIYCPNCDTRLEYDLKTRVSMGIIAAIILPGFILSGLQIIPIYMVFIGTYLSGLIFWKIRKLRIYEE
jgi:hypothetical protein